MVGHRCSGCSTSVAAYRSNIMWYVHYTTWKFLKNLKKITKIRKYQKRHNFKKISKLTPSWLGYFGRYHVSQIRISQYRSNQSESPWIWYICDSRIGMIPIPSVLITNRSNGSVSADIANHGCIWTERFGKIFKILSNPSNCLDYLEGI